MLEKPQPKSQDDRTGVSAELDKDPIASEMQAVLPSKSDGIGSMRSQGRKTKRIRTSRHSVTPKPTKTTQLTTQHVGTHDQKG